MDLRNGASDWKEGTYAVPLGGDAAERREITVQELGALLSGIDMQQATQRKRCQRSEQKSRLYLFFSWQRGSRQDIFQKIHRPYSRRC